jgi:hypothetical protein
MAFDFARSFSQRRTLRSCGLKFVYKYGQHWKLKKSRPAFLFGIAINAAVDWHFTEGVRLAHGGAPGVIRGLDAVDVFQWLWDGVKEADDAVVYPEKKPWDWWLKRGIGLLPAVLPELVRRIRIDVPLFSSGADTRPILLQERITYQVGGVKELVIPDLLGHVTLTPAECEALKLPVDGPTKRAVLDYKTSDRDYLPTQAELDEQLTSGQLAAEAVGFRPDVVGLCVLNYQVTNPHVQWVWAPRRDGAAIDRFIASVQWTEEIIQSGHFIANDRACHEFGGCDYMPLCFPSQAGRRDEELVREIRRDDTNENALIEEEL